MNTKPLPLRCMCGSNNLLTHVAIAGRFFVRCSDCDANGPVGKSRDDAVRRWNGKILTRHHEL